MSEAATDRAEVKQLGQAKHRIEVEKLRARWAMAGFDPIRHMRAATGEGDGMTMVGLARAEYDRGRVNFASWLAYRDIEDILSWVCRRGAAAVQREAAHG